MAHLVEHVRKTALSRGVSGIRSIGRMFRVFDDNGCKKIDMNEFKYGLKDYGIDFTDEEYHELFIYFDRNGDGAIIFDEFLKALRPPIAACRETMIKKAFQKADKTGDGIINMDDLRGVYNVKEHPKYKSGEFTAKQVFLEFLNNFQQGSKDMDEKVTYDEFLNYYCGVSASIDNNAYFDLMIRNAWKL